VVLAHELIHVHRRDVPRQVLGRLALALYWFHPLSWVAARLSVVSR
jgi:beta-lactamase regulating signal transducer with metallopeptidase domain